ncbi:MAG: hypothetical protein LWW85_09920 [Marinilabiliales bacterium]|nr:hypothetical protein [Marinilabiliales bacterium]
MLSYKLRLAFSPVQLNVGELVDNSLDRYTRSKYLISTVNHKEEIEKQISNEIKILSIKPDTLIFNFSKIVSRKLPVRPNLQLDFDNQYSLQDVPVTNPDSVIVSGPKSAMDTMHCIRTAFKSFQNIQHSVREAISLISLPGFRYSEEHVTLQIPVEQNTEVSFEVPIQIHNCPKEVILKCFPGKVKVSCRIGFSKFKKLDYNAFHAYVSYDRLSLKESRIPVQLESLSNSAFAIRYSPHEVEYIIEHDNK